MQNACEVDRQIVALPRGDEWYIIIFAPEQRREAFRQVGQWALNSDLSFDWKDAAELSGSIRAACADQVDLEAVHHEAHPGLGTLPSGLPGDAGGIA